MLKLANRHIVPELNLSQGNTIHLPLNLILRLNVFISNLFQKAF